MEVLFLCFYSDADPRDRSAPALALFARLPRAGAFLFAYSPRRCSLPIYCSVGFVLIRGARARPARWDWSSPSIGFHPIGHRRRFGFTRLVTGIVPGRSISLGGKPFL